MYDRWCRYWSGTAGAIFDSTTPAPMARRKKEIFCNFESAACACSVSHLSRHHERINTVPSLKDWRYGSTDHDDTGDTASGYTENGGRIPAKLGICKPAAKNGSDPMSPVLLSGSSARCILTYARNKESGPRATADCCPCQAHRRVARLLWPAHQRHGRPWAEGTA